MAVFQCKLLLFLTICLAGKAQGQDNFNIVEPYPNNIYAVEFSSAQVTCAAFDSSGIKTPEKILFMRRNMFALYTKLEANDNLNFTNHTEVIFQGGKQLKKLYVTLHIRNITEKDSSQNPMLGRYECHAFAVGDPSERRHGFSVNVIRRYEIPIVSVTKPRILQHGDNVTLFCNLTGGSSASALKRISWYKNGVRMPCPNSVRYPDPSSPEDFLEPLVLTNVGAEDGGNYTCLLEVLLRHWKQHNVSDSLRVLVAPWFDEPTQVKTLKRRKGDSVSLECSAKGYPLEVTWKMEQIKDGAVNAPAYISETKGKYQIQRKGVYEPYVLTIFNLQKSDGRRYYCCIASKSPSGVSANDDCQVFNVEVHDESRPTANTSTGIV